MQWWLLPHWSKERHVEYNTFNARSDTVTKPSPWMLEAMMKAPVGDDVFGEDPSITELEMMAATMFGMEAALF